MVLRDYFWLCIQESLVMGSEDHKGIQDETPVGCVHDKLLTCYNIIIAPRMVCRNVIAGWYSWYTSNISRKCQTSTTGPIYWHIKIPYSPHIGQYWLFLVFVRWVGLAGRKWKFSIILISMKTKMNISSGSVGPVMTCVKTKIFKSQLVKSIRNSQRKER